MRSTAVKMSREYPHLPAAWATQVVLTLRARGASGTRIGEALAVAEAHCADSGELPGETFGSPTEYADTVRVTPQEQADASLTANIVAAWPSLLGLAALVLSLDTVVALRESTSVPLRGGSLVSIGAIIVFAVLIAWRADLLLARLRVAIPLFVLAFLGAVFLQTVWREPVAHLAAVPTAGLVIVLLIGSVWGGYRVAATDPVSDPLRGDPSPKATRVVHLLSPWLFVIITVVTAGLALLPLGGN